MWWYARNLTYCWLNSNSRGCWSKSWNRENKGVGCVCVGGVNHQWSDWAHPIALWLRTRLVHKSPKTNTIRRRKVLLLPPARGCGRVGDIIILKTVCPERKTTGCLVATWVHWQKQQLVPRWSTSIFSAWSNPPPPPHPHQPTVVIVVQNHWDPCQASSAARGVGPCRNYVLM